MTISELQKEDVRNLIRQGRKIEAVKYLRDSFGLSLKHANQITDHISCELQDELIKSFTDYTFHTETSQRRGLGVARLISGIFAFIGIIFLGISLIVYENNSDFVDKAVKVKGVVINYPGRPLFEYEYQDQKYNYQTTASSNPPSYSIGEEVEIFINPAHPQEALVDNFSERWLLTTIFGCMGLLFFSIGFGSFFIIGKQ